MSIKDTNDNSKDINMSQKISIPQGKGSIFPLKFEDGSDPLKIENSQIKHVKFSRLLNFISFRVINTV